MKIEIKNKIEKHIVYNIYIYIYLYIYNNKYITNILHKHEMYNKNKTSYNMNMKYLIENSDFTKL